MKERKTGKIAGVVHNKTILKEQMKKLFDSGELGPADSLSPAQLQSTAWLYLGLFFVRRKRRENQRQLKPTTLSLRKSSKWVQYYELNRKSAWFSAGHTDAEDESDAHIFSVTVSEKCPGKTIKNNVSHRNPTSDALFRRSRDSESAKFKSSASCWIEVKICTALLSPGAHFRTLLPGTLLIFF